MRVGNREIKDEGEGITECPPPKSHTYPEPGSVTSFRNRVFADIVKLKRDHTRIVWALCPKTSILIRRKYGPAYRETYRENHVMMEAELVELVYKECQGLPVTIRSWNKQAASLKKPSEHRPADTLI